MILCHPIRAVSLAIALSVILAPPGFAQTMGLRQILVASEAEAADVVRTVADGTRFDVVAAQRSLDTASGARGGYIGRMALGDLRPEFRLAVEGLAPGDVSGPVEIGDAWFVFQAVSDAESLWMDLDDAGAAALAIGVYDEAARSFEQALSIVESSAPESAQMIRSLDGLATAYRFLGRAAESEVLYDRALDLIATMDASPLEAAQLTNGLAATQMAQGRYDEAEANFEAALELRESALGADHPETVPIRFNIADVAAARDRHLLAARLYDEAFALLEDQLGPEHPATEAGAIRRETFRQSLIPALLDDFTVLVALSDFRDGEFEATLDDIEALLPIVPLSELSYVQMKDILLDVGLRDEAGMVLRRGLEAWEDSRLLRIYLADLMANTGRSEEAIALLDEATRIPPPAGLDDATSRQQEALIYQRMGDIHSGLNRFDAARTAYQRSLGVTEDVFGGWAKLGAVELASERIPEALAAYERGVAADPADPDVHLSLAEVYSAAGRWEDAAVSARTAIDLGTTNSRALYVLGTALVRTGDREDGQAQLREFQSVEAEFLDLEHEDREVDAITRSAIALFHGGDPDGAIDSLQAGIVTYPNAGRLRMNLATIESRLGQTEAAIASYEQMIALGVGPQFLVHRNLAEQYAAIGDDEAAQRHREIYRRTRESELIVYLPE